MKADRQDIVLALDRFQVGSPDAKVCVNDKDHGKLTAHPSGTGFICGKCGYKELASDALVAEALSAKPVEWRLPAAVE